MRSSCCRETLAVKDVFETEETLDCSQALKPGGNSKDSEETVMGGEPLA